MAWFEIALKIVPLINILLAVVIIFVERKDVNTTLTWLMVLLLLPVLGFFLYLLFGQNLSRHKIFKLKKKFLNTKYFNYCSYYFLFSRRILLHILVIYYSYINNFFQAEDGIRDKAT